LSSSDNPQFEPQPPSGLEPAPPAASESVHADNAASDVSATVTDPPAAEKPAWNGWDVLLLAALTFVSMIVS